MAEPVEDEGLLVGWVEKGRSAQIRAYLKHYKGRRILDLRLWFPPDDGSALRPSGKGFAIDASKARELADLLEEVADRTVTR